ncbi:hypothetical protein KVR01_001392 [Diaporthe batatas]|uniref:uncharacterized protein n=1 Tax=Diaporthe batatas TaxID=748121 RepID=UPI001D0401D1|nr:uncharacterized protein KVR01_001392 [Diaporthe batatas]KAG8168643.1 hypothetical protein KVR01_001392 [Diaporthe batatas]
MTAPAEPPRYVYKIVDTEPPFPIPDVFPPSELDKKDGFIHLSAPWQLPVTADLFFSSNTTLWVLKVRLASIGGAVRWEPPAGGGSSSEGYPHLYGSLGRADVESVERFKRTADERGVFQRRWKDVFSDSRWRAWEEGKGMAVEE